LSVTSVHKDAEDLTMTIATAFDSPVARIWQLWSDPRQLERWWGPPTYPATMVEHDLVTGGDVRYYMTSPEGNRHHGWWHITSVEPPHRLEFEDGFADADGNPSAAMPVTTVTVALSEATEGGTTMTITSRFSSREAMGQLIAMGMEEGMVLALGQIEAILDAGRSRAVAAPPG
jgi:uncharacterized protein YndB with AHSA1/START domain